MTAVAGLLPLDCYAQTSVTFFNNGTNWTVNQSGLNSANITSNVFHSTDGNGGETVSAWYNRPVYINGFTASFTYRDVGGSLGNNADGLTFDVQENGPAFLGGTGGSLGVNGLSPSANWEFNLYSPNGIGAIFHTDGIASGYESTGSVNVSSGHPINVTIVYSPGGAVEETLADTVTSSTFVTNYNIGDLVVLLGNSLAYIGFTSTDGGVNSVQTVSNFSFVSATNMLNQGGAVALSYPAQGSVMPTLRSVQVNFNQAVTNVIAGDLLIDNVPATNVTAYTPSIYVFEFPEPAMGSVGVNWASNAGIVSIAGQTNVGLGGGWSYTLDRLLPQPSIEISEFMAANKSTLSDSFGESSDWIEIHNGTSAVANLAGWSLSVDASNLTEWTFPDYVLESGDYLVVFASGRNLTAVTNELHTNFKLPAAGSFLALVDPNTNLVSFFAPQYPPQSTDVSYGVDPFLKNAIGYYTIPTPGNPNDPAGPGFTAEPAFSQAGGTFVSPFNLTITDATTNAVVRYTTDGTMPTDQSPILAGPLLINGSVQVRTRAFAEGLLPGPIHSESYIQLASDVVQQTSDMPALIIYNFDAGVPNTAEGTPDQFANFSFYEPSNGITRLTNAPTLSARAGFHVHGSSTRGDAKQSWTVQFWDDFNNSTDETPLELPAGKDWVLYAPDNFEPVLIHNPLMYQLSRDIGRYAPNTHLLEVYLHTTTGPVTSNDYFGIYVLEEKIKRATNRVDISKLQDDDNTPPNVTGGYILAIDRLPPGDNGLNAAGQTMVYEDPEELDILTPERAPQQSYIQNYLNQFYAALISSSYTNTATGYPAYIDVHSWIDHHILNVAAFNVDALRLSAYFYKPRQGSLVFGPIWDFDRSQGSTDGRDFDPFVWRAFTQDGGTDYFNYIWWGQMFTDPDFWQKWIDRYESLRQGMLSTNHIYADIDALVAQVQNEEPREIARWPDYTTPRSGTFSYGTGFSYTFPGTYAGEVTFLKQWYADRLEFIDTNLLAMPTLVSNAVAGSSGSTVTITGPAGATIYYTIDGTDPRLSGGAISPIAQAYQSPIAITSNTVVTARAFNAKHFNLTGPNNPPISSPWSGLAVSTIGLVTSPSAVGYGTADSVYTQNFDSLPNPGATSVNSDNPVTINGVTYYLGIPMGLHFRWIRPGRHWVRMAWAFRISWRAGTGWLTTLPASAHVLARPTEIRRQADRSVLARPTAPIARLGCWPQVPQGSRHLVSSC
ncbi:MAG TPA: CotH kinase family protein [Verrucomicrobiae bacterium]|nr:CotH kinase family protein [Verrucomicrobiae bacterium]